MHEIWLRPNRRALWFGAVPPLLIAAIGMWMATSASFANAWIRSVGITLLVLAVLILVAIGRQFLRPRIAYRDGYVLFNLRAGSPITVPIEYVEAFFVGQGPALLPGRTAENEKTYNLVARLAQRQVDWANREVNPALGNWAEGYVTVRGTWCEPLEQELVRKLNRRLKEVKEHHAAEQTATTKNATA